MMDWKKVYVWWDEAGCLQITESKPKHGHSFEMLYMESEFDKLLMQPEGTEPFKIDEEFVALRMNRR